MGTENISKTELLDKIGDMSMKIDFAHAIVDLIAEVNPEGLQEDSVRRAAFHVREILEELVPHYRLLSTAALQK